MKIYLSSAESPHNTELLLKMDMPKRLLVSYYYMRKKTDAYNLDMLKKLRAQGNDLMLDSGAHSFLNELESQQGGRQNVPQKKMTKTDQSPEDYFEGYMKFLEKYKDFFNYIVELDIDAIVGYPLILKWRQRMLDLGIPKERLFVVFHATIPDCIKEWENWCKDGFVVGVGGFPSVAVHDLLFRIALKYNTKVHGFAMTKNWWVLKYPWYSVDSSTWNTGTRYGILFYFDRNDYGIKGFKLREAQTSKRAREKFLNLIYPMIRKYVNIPLKDFFEDRTCVKSIDLCNIMAFIEQEKELTKLWARRGVVYNN